ncbi:MAG: histidinol dehydrogenase, partial [Deltaproteobacteria bacterium]|nr:histidinol dehydrogenase [Deltaproteobacteria bacterium]
MIKVERLAKMAPQRRFAIMARSAADLGPIMNKTKEILEALRADPAAELRREYAPEGKGFVLSDLRVSSEEIDEAELLCPPGLMEALAAAKGNIERFHFEQLERPMWMTEISEGLLAGRMTMPLETVGVYIPGGRASYPSSALMNIVPAVVAGVERVVAVTPPDKDLKARPEILAACRLAGATEIYKLGGAWAVGCLAYGLGGLPKVDKIVGPGSSWVMAAKMAVFGLVDIDSPAGPSEGFIIADKSADPRFMAWDLISQLEHDPQASAVLATDDEDLAEQVASLVNSELPNLERSSIVEQSLSHAAIILVNDIAEAFELAERYAPEHLEIVVSDPMSWLGRVRHAGSIFLGPWAPIPAGDYATGTNHVLPTGGAARAFSGLSTDTFLRKTTFQQLSREALAALAPTVSLLARAEGLPAHAKCVEIRTQEPGQPTAGWPDDGGVSSCSVSSVTPPWRKPAGILAKRRALENLKVKRAPRKSLGLKMSEKDYIKMSIIKKRCEIIIKLLNENNYSQQIFSDSYILQGAIAMELLQIGIKLRSLSRGFKQSPANAIAVDAIYDLRDRIFHNYEEIHLSEIWEVITRDIPALHTFSKKSVAEYEAEQKRKLEETD